MAEAAVFALGPAVAFAVAGRFARRTGVLASCIQVAHWLAPVARRLQAAVVTLSVTAVGQGDT